MTVNTHFIHQWHLRVCFSWLRVCFRAFRTCQYIGCLDGSNCSDFHWYVVSYTSSYLCLHYIEMRWHFKSNNSFLRLQFLYASTSSYTPKQKARWTNRLTHAQRQIKRPNISNLIVMCNTAHGTVDTERSKRNYLWMKNTESVVFGRPDRDFKVHREQWRIENSTLAIHSFYLLLLIAISIAIKWYSLKHMQFSQVQFIALLLLSAIGKGLERERNRQKALANVAESDTKQSI